MPAAFSPSSVKETTRSFATDRSLASTDDRQSCSLADASIAERAAANPDRLAASPYRDHTGLPASLRMKKCFRRASHRGSSSRSSGRPREGCHRQRGLGGRDDDAASRAEPARREASADASPPAMPVRETMEIVTVVFHAGSNRPEPFGVGRETSCSFPPRTATRDRRRRHCEVRTLATPRVSRTSPPRRIALRAPDPFVRPGLRLFGTVAPDLGTERNADLSRARCRCCRSA